MSEYFPKPNYLGANVKRELDLSINARKTVLKYAAGVGTSDFAKKTDLTNLKPDVDKLHTDKLSNLKIKVDKLDIGKLETTAVDLSKLSNVVKNDAVKNTEYNELVKKVMILMRLILVI